MEVRRQNILNASDEIIEYIRLNGISNELLTRYNINRANLAWIFRMKGININEVKPQKKTRAEILKQEIIGHITKHGITECAAAKFGYSVKRLYDYSRRWGVDLPFATDFNQPRSYEKKQLDRAVVEEMLKQNLCLSYIAERLRTTSSTLKHRLKKWNLPIPQNQRGKHGGMPVAARYVPDLNALDNIDEECKTALYHFAGPTSAEMFGMSVKLLKECGLNLKTKSIIDKR